MCPHPAKGATMSVTAVVVSYNVRDLLLQGLTSLEAARQRGTLDRIIVVDNDSDDDSVKAVREHFPETEIIEAANNGYGAGANRGIEQTTTDYVLVLNPDTVVPAETISCLAQYLDENPGVAVAAPRMRYPDGSLQPSRRRFPRRLTPVFESTILSQRFPGNPWARHYRMEDVEEDQVQQVDWVVGACMLVRMEAINQAGGFDESFWMYCEEVEWCWRLRRHGWTTVYIPEVEIVHHEAASTSQNIGRRQLAFDRSRVQLQRRIYGNTTANIVAAGIQAGYFLQVLMELLKLTAGHRRDVRKQRIREYLRLMRAGLRQGAGKP